MSELNLIPFVVVFVFIILIGLGLENVPQIVVEIILLHGFINHGKLFKELIQVKNRVIAKMTRFICLKSGANKHYSIYLLVFVNI